MKYPKKTKYPKLMKEMPVIIATIMGRGRKGCPIRYAFATPFQSDVENAMSDLGYGVNQYCLWYGVLTTCKESPFSS